MTKSALPVSALLAAGLLAVALPAGGPAFGQQATGTPDKTHGVTTEARVEQRITQMHKRLKITPAEEPAWDAFAQVMRTNVTSMEQAYRQRASSVGTMTATENLRNFAQIESSRAQGVQDLSASFDSLYGTLSDEQKKTADAMFRHYEEGRADGRHGAGQQGAGQGGGAQSGGSRSSGVPSGGDRGETPKPEPKTPG